MSQIQETKHDPGHVLPTDREAQKLFHKQTPHGKRIYVYSIVASLLVVGAIFTANGSNNLLRTAQCRETRQVTCDGPEDPVMVDPIDPRCATKPEHPKCQPFDPVDPDPGDPGDEEPIPPTPPTEASKLLSGTVNDPDGFEVPAGEVWVFDPTKNTTVEVEANVVVRGVLEMRPNTGVTHTLRFKNVDTSKFVGGGVELIDDDTGLWVLDNGILDIEGEKKTGWNRTGTDPTWKSSDEIKVAPVNVGDYTAKPFTLGSTVPQLDSSVPKAEVFNLTRSVNIEGTPSGHSHVTLLSSQKQTIKYAAFRYLGVSTTLGRYPIHFHFMGDASRGSLVEGTVVRDSDEHAYVAHASHGVTFRDTVAYNVQDSAYWWDPIKGTGSDANATDDIVYDHALAVQIEKDESHPHSLCGFALVAGKGGAIFDSAAAAVNGQTNAAGYCWPANDLQVWAFHDNVAHNNPKNGIFVWHNDTTPHLISDYIAYANGSAGIDHGAYGNAYSYSDVYLYKNKVGIELHSGGKGNPVWACIVEKASTSGIGLNVLNTNAAEFNPFEFREASIASSVANNSNGDKLEDRVVFTNGTCPAN